uniref:Protein krueppel n=1 Tax=Anopheles minimus TaxID=112268 RepID=A0A182WCX3_9DIPT
MASSSDMEDLMFGEICRCCMASKPRMKPLFDTNLFAMLNAITGLNVHQNDGLPSQLCVPCVLQIRRSHYFKLQCESTDVALRSYVLDTKHVETHDFTTTFDGKYVKQEQNSSAIPAHNGNGTEAECTANHTAGQPVKLFCQPCKKEFETEKKLRRHMRRHFTDKPHVCNECGVSFLENRLRAHRRTEHLNVVYHCPVCDKEFKRATQLNVHVKMHHPDVPITSEGVCFLNEETNIGKDGSVKKSPWSRQRTKQMAESIDFDETYLDQDDEEEEEEEEEEEDEEERGKVDEEIDGNVSMLEEYEEGETHSNEEYLVDALSNVGSIVEQENYEDFVTEYTMVKEEPLLEISIMNPDDVSSDIEQ